MLARWQFWVTTVVALLVAVTAGYAIMLAGQNRMASADLTLRMQNVQRAVQLEPLYRDIVKALADLSVRNQDKALSDLLASQGITVNANANAAAPAAAPAAPPAASTPDTKKGARP